MIGRFINWRQDTRDILIEEAKRLQIKAERMPAGVERDRILKRAHSLEIEANAENWATSPELQPPK